MLIATALKTAAATACASEPAALPRRGVPVAAARPGGRVHLVHVGRVRSGARSVPSARRPACGTRSRRLYLVEAAEVAPRDAASVQPGGAPPVCRRCVAHLERTSTPRSKWAAYPELPPTLTDLVVGAVFAVNLGECDQVEAAAKALYGRRALAAYVRCGDHARPWLRDLAGGPIAMVLDPHLAGGGVSLAWVLDRRRGQIWPGSRHGRAVFSSHPDHYHDDVSEHAA